jgi:hypothetical protein
MRTADPLMPHPQDKYRAQVTVAHTVWDSDALVPNPSAVASHRVYYAMLSSNKHVWFYTEGTRQYLNHQGIRPGMIEAIHQGKAAAQAGAPIVSPPLPRK